MKFTLSIGAQMGRKLEVEERIKLCVYGDIRGNERMLPRADDILEG